MDEVAEVSDELMERYLEGEEISHEEIVHGAQERRHERHALPGHLRRRDEEPGHQPPARRARRGPAVAGQEGRLPRRRPRHRGRGRGRDDRVRVQDARRPVRGQDQPDARLPRRRSAPTRSCSTRRAHVKERMGQLLVPQGKEMEHTDELGAGRHRRGGEAEGDARGRRAGVEGRAGRDRAAEAARARHGVRDRAEAQGRRGQGLHGAAPAPGGGPDDRRPPRRPDRRADRRRADADPRRGDRRPDEGALRRRGERSSRRACPTARRSRAARRRTAATRSRRAAAASSATATSRSSRSRASRPGSSSRTRSRAA